MESTIHILLIDDDEDIHLLIKHLLRSDRYHVQSAYDAKEAWEKIDKPTALILLDISLPSGTEGIALLRDIKKQLPAVPVIILSKHGEIETVVEALRAGATDYYHKPDLNKVERFQKIVESTIKEFQGAEESHAANSPHGISGFEDVIGGAESTREMIKLARLVAAENINVLLLGDTGTGKEILARSIHRNSPRSRGPFIALNCASIPEQLAESELFGHVKGAFTGAVASHNGKFVQAHTGTLFLDEIGELSLALQAKLLKVLEDKIVTPVGGTTSTTVDIRIIVATNRDLEQEVSQKRFREDLFYRIHGFPIQLPSLRERKDDIPLLVDFFIKKHGGDRSPAINPKLLNALKAFRYRGNIRQLENMIQYALIVVEKNEMRIRHFPMLKRADQVADVLTLAQAERQAVEAALAAANYRKSKAAKLLDISRPTLNKKIQDYKISLPQKN